MHSHAHRLTCARVLAMRNQHRGASRALQAQTARPQHLVLAVMCGPAAELGVVPGSNMPRLHYARLILHHHVAATIACNHSLLSCPATIACYHALQP